MRVHSNIAIVASALLSLSMWAAEQPTALNEKIDSWIEGTVLTLDADTGKFTVRGTSRPYAAIYGDMLHEIDQKTVGLDADARAKKSAEIRISFNEKLARAKDPDAQLPSDFTFYLTGKEKQLLVVNEAGFYGHKEADPAPAVKLSDHERRTMESLRDMKIGEHVVIGYDSGVVYNNAYALIKVSGGPIPASFKTEETGPEGKAPVDATVRPALEPAIASNDTVAASKEDIETTRLIRENINADKGLSAEARAVQVITIAGTVTLRGSVANADERRIVFNKAAARVGEARVKNELEISTK